MDYKFSKKPVDNEVKITVDESIIDTSKVLSKEEALEVAKESRREKKNLIGGNTQAKLGLESSLGKDDRMFQLRSGFNSGEYVTVTSASKGVGVSRETIIKYAKEMNLDMLDDQKGVWLGKKD